MPSERDPIHQMKDRTPHPNAQSRSLQELDPPLLYDAATPDRRLRDETGFRGRE
jgi:hypothetical protein